jgi:hypothetical protein
VVCFWRRCRPAGQECQRVFGGGARLRREGEHGLAFIAGEVQRLELQGQVPGHRVVEALGSRGVDPHVVPGPQPGEESAAGGQFPDQLVQALSCGFRPDSSGASPPWWPRSRSNRGRSPPRPDRGRGTVPGSAAWSGVSGPNDSTEVNTGPYRARPSWLAASRSERPFCTMATTPVIPSSRRSTPGRTRCCGGRRGVPARRRVGRPCQVHQVCPLGLVQLKGGGHSLEHRVETLRGGCRVPAACSSPCSPRRAAPLPHGAGPAPGAAPRSWGIPACSGLIFARREIRNSRISSFLSTASTLRSLFRQWQCLSDTPTKGGWSPATGKPTG